MYLKSFCCSLLFMAAAISLQAPSFAYTADQTTHTLTVSPGADNTATTNDLRNAFSYLANRADKTTRWTWKFNPGKYTMTLPVYGAGLKNVDMVSDANNPAVLMKAPSWNTANGNAIFYLKMGSSLSLQGFQFYGLTDFSAGPTAVFGDSGVYFGSCNGVTVDNNKFYNFGDAALRVTTNESDPVIGVNSFNTTVTNNTFDNIYQISTTPNDEVHGGTANYTLQNNTFTRLHGSVKFASRTAGAQNVKIAYNVINGGDHYGIEINNYNNLTITNNTIANLAEVAITAYTDPRASSDFDWGNNFTISQNTIQNVSRALRFSPTPYADGYSFVPTNLVIDNNSMTTLKDPSNPAISILNGNVAGVQVTYNKFNQVTSKKYISISAGSTAITQLGNSVNGLAYGPQPTTAAVTK